MVNLDEIQKLRLIYTSKKSREGKFEPIKKGFAIPEARLNGIKDFFEENKKANVVLMFVDISKFSKKTLNKSNEYIMKFLNNYYDFVIPTIYEFGGEIDRIMGDGIICVFGSPFLQDKELKELFNKAEKCAYKILKKLSGTMFESKVALHSGEVIYINNIFSEYNEYTIIGQPLTDLYRLESASVDNAINYFEGSDYSNYQFWSQINFLLKLIKNLISELKGEVIEADQPIKLLNLAEDCIDATNLSGIKWSTIRYLTLV